MGGAGDGPRGAWSLPRRDKQYEPGNVGLSRGAHFRLARGNVHRPFGPIRACQRHDRTRQCNHLMTRLKLSSFAHGIPKPCLFSCQGLSNINRDHFISIAPQPLNSKCSNLWSPDSLQACRGRSPVQWVAAPCSRTCWLAESSPEPFSAARGGRRPVRRRLRSVFTGSG